MSNKAGEEFHGLYICQVMGAISQRFLAATDKWMQRGGEDSGSHGRCELAYETFLQMNSVEKVTFLLILQSNRKIKGTSKL